MLKTTNYIQHAVATQLSATSPQAEQPACVRVPLRPHQRTLLAAARALEKHATIDPSTLSETQLYSSYGVLGDRVGAGKSLVALSLVCDPPVAVSKMEVVASGGARTIRVTTMDPIQEYATPRETPPLVEESVSDVSDEESESGGDEEVGRSNGSTFIIARSLKPRHNSVFYSKVSVLVCPHNVVQQWATYIKDQTTLRPVIIQRARDFTHTSSALEIAFINTVFSSDILVISCTMLKKFADLLTSRGDPLDTFMWSRLFIDEADSVTVPIRPGYLRARFTWFITGSWLNMLLPAGVRANKMMSLDPDTRQMLGNGPISGLNGGSVFVTHAIARTEEIAFTPLILRNSDAWINASIRGPTIHHDTIICSAPIQVELLRGLIAPAAMEALHAGDTTGALTALGLHPTSKETIVTTVTASLRRELTQAEKWLSYARDKDYSSPSAKLHSLERAEASVSELEAKIALLEERVAAVAEIADCPCPICYDAVDTPTLTPCCRQTFCLSCLCECILSNPHCPLCRVKVNSVKDLIVVGQGAEVEAEAKTTVMPEKAEVPTKGLALLKLLTESRESQRFLVFSAHEASFDGLRQLLSARGIRCELLHGTANRIKTLRAKFLSGEVRVLCMNTRNVGAGINLEMTTDVVLFHRMNIEMERQVIGRAVRFERLTDLRVTHLVHENETAFTRPTDVIVHV